MLLPVPVHSEQAMLHVEHMLLLSTLPTLHMVQAVAEVHPIQVLGQTVHILLFRKYPSPQIMQTVFELHETQPTEQRAHCTPCTKYEPGMQARQKLALIVQMLQIGEHRLQVPSLLEK